MRILHIINDLRIAGAERLLADLAPRQRDAGLSVSVTTLSSQPSFLETALREAGIPVRIPDRALPFLSPGHIGRLTEEMRHADIVHIHLFPAQLWASLATFPLGKKAPRLVTTEHNTHNRRREKPFLKPIDAGMYRRYDRIVAISEATRDALADYLPETKSRITVIPNGIALERFTGIGSPEERATLLPDIPASAPLLLSIGRLETQKDILTQLRAVAVIPAVHLALVGDGPLHDQLHLEVKNRGISDRVHFLGRRDDVPALLRNTDLYLQSSAWEGFGIAAVEAMASGLPVVHSDVPGLREVVGENAGVRFPAGDAETLARVLRSLLSDASRRQTLGQAARVQAQQFSIERSVTAHLALYRFL